jgi:hypothetical protein
MWSGHSSARLGAMTVLGLCAWAMPVAAQTADETYHQQLEQYRNQRDDYREQRDRYERRLERYEYDRSHPAWWWRVRYEDATLDAFYRLPRYRLIGMDVDERDGLRVGRIRDIERAPDGRVERVEIALRGSDEVAWLDADHLRVDPDNNIAFTDISADAIYDREQDRYYDARP